MFWRSLMALSLTAPVCAFIAKSSIAVTAKRPLVVSLMVVVARVGFFIVGGIVQYLSVSVKYGGAVADCLFKWWYSLILLYLFGFLNQLVMFFEERQSGRFAGKRFQNDLIYF